MSRARAGESAAFGELVRRHQRAALRVAAVVSGSTAEASDISQEGFVKAYQSTASYQGTGSDVDAPGETSLAPPVDVGVSGLPGPGVSREVTVNGRVVLVSVIDGVLADEVLVKTLGPDTDIVEVAVGDTPGLWISGAPHELAYFLPDGSTAFERVAGNTLVWQDGQMIGRVEGFESIDEAIEFASELGTND